MSLPAPVEDALQAFLYRVQTGAAVGGDRLAPEEIVRLLAAPLAPADPLIARAVTALRVVAERERARGAAEARLAAALDETVEAPGARWTRERDTVLAGAPPSVVRAAVEAVPWPGFLARTWRAIRGG